jgi:outer membrane protein with beta-barrel domain
MKIQLLTFIILFSIFTQAQIQVGIQAGYNHAYLTPNSSYSTTYTYTSSPFAGFQAGVVIETGLAENWNFRSGLMISDKGTRLRKEGFGYPSAWSIELYYLEIPLSVVRRWKISKSSWSIFAGGGLFASRGVRGLEKGQGVSLNGTYDISDYVEFRSKNKGNDGRPTIINPYDYGCMIIAGVQRRKIQLLLSYEHSLHRLFPTSLVFEHKFAFRVISLSATFLLNKKRE